MSAVPRPTRTRLDVEQFHKMGEAGVLAPDSRVELVEGELWDMAPLGRRHVRAARVLTRLLNRHPVGDRIVVSSPGVARLSNLTELYPDVLVLRPRADDYSDSHPDVADVLLLIEVSDSTLRHDTTTKLDLYARYGVSEVWVLDVRRRQLHLYRENRGGRYTDVRALSPGEPAAPLTLPELMLDWGEAVRAPAASSA